MTSEDIQAQIAEIERRKILWNLANPFYEECAYLEYVAAQKRLEAMYNEMRDHHAKAVTYEIPATAQKK